jgi:BolA protein
MTFINTDDRIELSYIGKQMNMQRKQRILETLQHNLDIDYISVCDESNQHHVPQGAQTHFKVTLVSPEFDNMTRINRHKKINGLLMAEFEQGLHALSLHLFSPTEWAKGNGSPDSPKCKGGFKHG